MSGTLTHTVADVVAQVLIDLGVVTDPLLGSAWPVFVEAEPDLPDNVVTIYVTAGRLGGRTHFDGETQVHHGIQIRVRSTTTNVGQVKANAISNQIDVVNRLTVTIDAVEYLVQAITKTTEVLPIGKESPTSERQLFTINAVVALRQTT